MDNAAAPRPKRRGTWFVVILGLLEIAAIVAFFELKGFAGAVCSAAGALPAAGAAVGASAAGGAVAPIAGGGGGNDMQGGAASPAAAPVVSAAPQPDSSPAAAAAPAAAGDAKVSGDTNQIVDPNCVAKTAAGMLSTDTPAPGPTCGPMKQPEALKKAEEQISK